MSLPEFSTLVSVQQRANSKRILGWTDDDADSIPDADTLTQGFQYASGVLFEYLAPRFGETQVAAWTRATAPARVLAMSDDLCLQFFSTRNNAQNPLVRELYTDVIESLTAIREGTRGLYGATENMDDKSVVEDLDSLYEDSQYF